MANNKNVVKPIKYTEGTEENPFAGLSNKPPGRYSVTYNDCTYTVTVRENRSFVNFNLAGDASTDGTNSNSFYENENYSGIDVTMSNGGSNYKATSATGSAQAASLINEEFGTSNNNTTYIGFSLNGTSCARLAADYYSEHPEKHNPFVVSIEACDNNKYKDPKKGIGTWGMTISPKQRDALINSDALIFSIHQKGKNSRNLAAYYGSYDGVRMIDMSVVIRTTSKNRNGEIITGKQVTEGHMILERWLYESGISDIGSGNFDLSNLKTEVTYKGKLYRINLDEITFKVPYIDENGKVKYRDISFEEVNKMIFAQNWAAKFGDRVELPEYLSDEDREFYGTVLRCDNAYLADWLATTYSAVSTASADVNPTSVSVSSTVSVASKESIIVGQVGSIQKNLIDKFKGELKAIAAVGTKHEETDRTLQHEEREVLEV